MILNGTEIIKLIGLSKTDRRVREFIKDRPINDEYGVISVDFDDLGLELGFDGLTITDKQKAECIGGLYLNDICFYDNCNFFPFNISIEDNLKVVEEKMNLKANYIDINDPEGLFWMYEELGWFTIQFTDERYERVDSIYIRPFENPETSRLNTIMKLIKK